MEFLDNKQGRLLGDEIKKRISSSATLSISTGYFTVFAFYYLRDKLKSCARARILLLSNPISKASFGLDITTNNDPVLFGDDSEQELKNLLVLRYASQEFADWIQKKADISTLIISNSFGLKMVLISNKELESVAINNNLSDFTASSLGYITSDRIPCNILQAEPEVVIQYQRMFDQIWNNPSLMKDAKKNLLSLLERGYKDYSPDFVYHYTLKNIFSESLKDLQDDTLIKTKTGFKEKVIWQKLYKFQQDGVMGALEKIEKYGGCIIADSVGLGKTFEALAIIKYYELRNDRVLVLCPRKLRDNWTVYTQNDKRNIFVQDRFNYDVLNHTDLTRSKGHSGNIELRTINWSNYDLVVIDESHNFRNNNPHKGETTRYAKLMNEIIRKGVKTRLLMLSATPVNNRMNDLKNQIAFITEGDDVAFVEEGIDNISNVMNLAQRQFAEWTKSEERNINTLFDKLDNRYFKLLDMLTIARSRKHIVKYYTTLDLGKFPERLKPINIKSDIASSFPSLKLINRTIQMLNLANFSPIEYVLPEKKSEYEAKYDYTLSSGSVFKQADREQSLIHLMRVNYLKRMESSIHSFSLSIKGLLEQVNDKLDKIANASSLIDNSISIEDIDLEEDSDNDSLIGNKVKVLIQDMDLIRWKQDLEYDKEQLTKLYESALKVTVARDEKLDRIKKLIAAKVNNPINDGNKKVIVFTAFADTAEYLYKELSVWAKAELKIHSTLITGSGTNRTTLPGVGSDMNDLLTHFSPRSKERDKTGSKLKEEIDLLIATDCISEGQNLQDCDYLINYDIHWNPVRIIQRFGRIDRLGSTNAQIQLVNFWPNMELNEYINLESRVKGKMVLLDISATGEENLIEMNDNDEMNDLEYRRKQLEQLQNTVLDLEDMQGGITITDSTMTDFRMDLLDYSMNNQSELDNTPAGIHAVVGINDADLQEGVIFCMRSKVPAKGKSLLSPYYLVYVSLEGEILLSYTQGKRCLDYYKKLCQGESHVIVDFAEKVKKESANYSNMSRYSDLLQLAMESIIGKQHEVGAASFFSTEGVVMDVEGIHSNADFEIVSFLIIRKE